MSEYWSGGGLTRKMGDTIRKTASRHDEQVLEGLVAPERSHGHDREVSGPPATTPSPPG